MTLLSSSSAPVSALGGQLCERALRDGTALVGLLHLPASFVPIEGVAYLMVEHNDRVGVVPEALDQGLKETHASYGVGELMISPLWNKTTSPAARVVRFFEASPDSNHWVVFGPSHHPLPAGAASHRWRAADPAGSWHDMPPPIEANGLALSQILTEHPIWPNAQGVLHTLSALPSPWREHYHRYHQLLARSARDPDLDGRLEAVLREDPIFSQIHYGRVDRQFCAFLAAMDDHGMLRVDAPRSAAEQAQRDQMGMAHLCASLATESVPEKPIADKVRSRRTP